MTYQNEAYPRIFKIGRDQQNRDWGRVWRDSESHGWATSHLLGRRGRNWLTKSKDREARVGLRICRQSLSNPQSDKLSRRLTTSLPFLYLLFNPSLDCTNLSPPPLGPLTISHPSNPP